MGVILAIRKVFLILSLLCLREQGTPWQLSKQISKLYIQLSVQIYSLLGKTEGDRKAFSEGARRKITLLDYPQEHLVVKMKKSFLL